MNMKNFGVVSGRLTRDIEIKTNEAGIARGYINVAVDRNFKNKDGEYDTDFLSFSVFGKTAEFAGKYFKKGSAIQVQFTVRSYTKEVEVDGNKVNRTMIDLVAESVEFPLTQSKAERDASKGNAEAPVEAPSNAEFAELAADDDDLPF